MVLIMLQPSALGIGEIGFSAAYMYISSSAPNKRSLGARNGLAQVAASTQRMVGPAAADRLFAFSMTNNTGRELCILVALVGVGVCISAQLPRNVWTHRTD